MSSEVAVPKSSVVAVVGESDPASAVNVTTTPGTPAPDTFSTRAEIVDVPPLARLKVVDVVEEHLLEVADRRLDVARHGDVDDEERPVRRVRITSWTCAASAPLGGAGRRHHDVRRAEHVVDAAHGAAVAPPIASARPRRCASVRLAMVICCTCWLAGAWR